MRKGLNSLIILVAWEIWKHRNVCVFEGTSPNVQEVLHAVAIEGSLWCMAWSLCSSRAAPSVANHLAMSLCVFPCAVGVCGVLESLSLVLGMDS